MEAFRNYAKKWIVSFAFAYLVIAPFALPALYWLFHEVEKMHHKQTEYQKKTIEFLDKRIKLLKERLRHEKTI